jgi:hypothetical protein
MKAFPGQPVQIDTPYDIKDHYGRDCGGRLTIYASKDGKFRGRFQPTRAGCHYQKDSPVGASGANRWIGTGYATQEACEAAGDVMVEAYRKKCAKKFPANVAA